MILLLVAYLGGMLTLLSPCILPILPAVVTRTGQPFLRSGLPLLLGMALCFAGVGLLVGVGGGWVVRAHAAGRLLAMVLVAVFGAALLFPALADRLARPFRRLGQRLSQRFDPARSANPRGGMAASALMGVAVGLLWAPCAGPILGLVLSGAALQGPGLYTALLLLAYALGAGTSLAVVLLAGGRLGRWLRRTAGPVTWIRRVAGGAVLLGVGSVALGIDRGPLTRMAIANTTAVEQTLLAAVAPKRPSQPPLPVLGAMPSLSSGGPWLNSAPLSQQQLRGKVVLVNIWTYSCINCVRTLPYVRAWAEKYRPHGLVVIGVHTPEFAFERSKANVTQAAQRLGVTFPVVLDNNFRIWKSFNNRYWPAFYFIDDQGRIRHTHFGEGQYAKGERTIQRLLIEAGRTDVPSDLVKPGN